MHQKSNQRGEATDHRNLTTERPVTLVYKYRLKVRILPTH